MGGRYTYPPCQLNWVLLPSMIKSECVSLKFKVSRNAHVPNLDLRLPLQSVSAPSCSLFLDCKTKHHVAQDKAICETLAQGNHNLLSSVLLVKNIGVPFLEKHPKIPLKTIDYDG